ncbi:MAG: hypothetical protein PGN22_00030 [Agrobacterium cavarae]
MAILQSIRCGPFPFSKIKLDRSFIDESHSSQETLTIIRTRIGSRQGP